MPTESFDTLALFVAIVAGFLNAYGLENVPSWKDLPPLLKKAVVALAAVLVPLALEYIRSLCGGPVTALAMGECGPALEPSVFTAVVIAVVTWLVSQFAHGTNPLRKRRYVG